MLNKLCSVKRNFLAEYEPYWKNQLLIHKLINFQSQLLTTAKVSAAISICLDYFQYHVKRAKLS